MSDDEEQTPYDGAAAGAQETARPANGAGPASFVLTLWSCLRHPLAFFTNAAASEDRWQAMGFALVMHLIGFQAAALWELAFSPEEFKLALIRVAIAPIWVLASVWIGSEVMHGWLRVLRAVTSSRSVTHRVVAYCYATAVLGAVPLVGLRLGLAAAAVYQVMALRQAHRCPTWKAAAAVILTWAVLLGSVVLLALGSGGAETAPAD
jgi:hypothetical protein